MRVRRFLKPVIRAAGRVLPPPVFLATLGTARGAQRRTAAIAYNARRAFLALTGDWENFAMTSRVRTVLPHTLVGIRGLEATYRIATLMNELRIPGAFVELGVARGGCAALLGSQAFADSSLDRRLWLFDSFEGLPDPTAEDLDPTGAETGNHLTPLRRGSCLGTLEDVQTLLFERFKLPRERVTFVKGWFQDTLPIHASRVGPIAVLRIDGDWYESTRVSLEQLYEAVAPGGTVIVDDYESCYGCMKAVDEFLAHRALSVDMHFDGRGGCFFSKQAQPMTSGAGGA